MRSRLGSALRTGLTSHRDNYNIRHKKPKVYKDRLFIYIIYKKDYIIDNYNYNMLNYKSQKRKRYIYDLIKYNNYVK